MNYEYMKEYPCNGEKPDLPDDVLIQIRCDRHPELKGVWLYSGGQYDKEDTMYVREMFLEYGDPNTVTHFRIVDERYKQKSYWFERGELPPVGTECEMRYCGQPFILCKIKYMGDSLCVVEPESRGDKSFPLVGVEFRPLRTERDELIDRAKKVFKKYHPDLGDTMQRVYAGNLYDAGMLKKAEGEYD